MPKKNEWKRNAGNGLPSIEEFDACRHSGGVPADLGDLPWRHFLPVLRILALCDLFSKIIMDCRLGCISRVISTTNSDSLLNISQFPCSTHLVNQIIHLVLCHFRKWFFTLLNSTIEIIFETIYMVI